MRRRALLSTLATTAAGCTGPGDSAAGRSTPTGSTPPETSSPTDAGTPPLANATPTSTRGLSPTGTVSRDVSAGAVSSVRVTRFEEFSLSHRLSVTAGDTGPVLTVSVVNDGDEPWVVQTANAPAPFPGARGERADGEAVLVANVVTGAQTAAGGCSRASLAQQPMVDRVTLSPGAGARTEATVFNARENETCWPTGEYAFEQPLTVWTRDAAYEYTWSFALVV